MFEFHIALSLLEVTARKNRLLTYERLSRTLGGVDPAHIAFTELLDNISLKTHHEYGVLLSSLAVHGDTKTPGKHFYDLAKKLGYNTEAPDFWHCARAATYEHYLKK